MTREEAIVHIKDVICENNTIKPNIVVFEQEKEALYMAIQALEQEPKEITLEDVKGYCKPRCLAIITNELLYELTHPNIKALEQESKTGHWINDEFGSKCSCCGIHTHLDKFDRPMKFKYCSMCGARMVEPQESEDKE